jgi:branched-chain amino acid transport system ATP-binding protein
LQRKLRHRRPACVLDQGAVVYHAAAHELLADNEIKERYCSV